MNKPLECIEIAPANNWNWMLNEELMKRSKYSNFVELPVAAIVEHNVVSQQYPPKYLVVGVETVGEIQQDY